MIKGHSLRLIKSLTDRGSCTRSPDPVRRRKESPLYKKGYEFRLPTLASLELRSVRMALRHLGISAGRPYEKKSRYVPLEYGHDQVARLVRMLGLRRRVATRGARRESPRHASS